MQLLSVITNSRACYHQTTVIMALYHVSCRIQMFLTLVILKCLNLICYTVNVFSPGGKPCRDQWAGARGAEVPWACAFPGAVIEQLHSRVMKDSSMNTSSHTPQIFQSGTWCGVELDSQLSFDVKFNINLISFDVKCVSVWHLVWSSA